MICGKTFWFVVFINSLTANRVAALSRKDKELCIGAHNALRNLHKNTPPLEWDSYIAAAAQQYAEKLARKGAFKHDADKTFGENLYWSDQNRVGTCIDASLKWYSEIANYNFLTGSSSNGKNIGHFTQLVWKDTVKFGVGVATIKSRKYARYGNIETFIVAKYGPKGNMAGAYKENVRPRKAGAKTPTLRELEGGPKEVPCENLDNDRKCRWLIESPLYGPCNGPYKSYFTKKCFKMCGYC